MLVYPFYGWRSWSLGRVTAWSHIFSWKWNKCWKGFFWYIFPLKTIFSTKEINMSLETSIIWFQPISPALLLRLYPHKSCASANSLFTKSNNFLTFCLGGNNFCFLFCYPNRSKCYLSSEFQLNCHSLHLEVTSNFSVHLKFFTLTFGTGRAFIMA